MAENYVNGIGRDAPMLKEKGGGVGEIGKPPFVGRQTTAEQWRAMAGKSVQFEIHVASAKPFKGEDLHL